LFFHTYLISAVTPGEEGGGIFQYTDHYQHINVLCILCRALPVLEEDNRLVSLVQNLDKRYTGEDYSSAKSGER
jgi:hypothetical protein